MKIFLRACGALLVVASLAGCATTDQGSGVQQGVNVTRFHLGQPIARGEIRVETAAPGAGGSLEFAQQAAAVERELSRLGWSVTRDNPRSEQVALVSIQQGGRPYQGSRSSISFGVGAGSGGYYGSGVAGGVGATVPVGSAPGEVVMTELDVRIQRRSDATVYWEGRARLEARANTPLAGPTEAVNRLAAALFQEFPGESGRTVLIR
ncbi:MAG: DUF4136 domain-containing protein [Allosphingosinicella sp.]